VPIRSCCSSLALALQLVLASELGCTASQAVEPEKTPPASAPAGEAKVHPELREHAGKDAKCESADVCGFFLQVISPGSDAAPLLDKATKIVSGKCAGDIIVYRDKRNVMGAGPVFATAEEKRACETALGRSEPDPDFPSYGVWRVK
jgi:hypothetical protein